MSDPLLLSRVELLDRHDETGVDVFNPCSLLLTAEKKLIDFSKTFGLIEEKDQ